MLVHVKASFRAFSRILFHEISSNISCHRFVKALPCKVLLGDVYTPSDLFISGPAIGCLVMPEATNIEWLHFPAGFRSQGNGDDLMTPHVGDELDGDV